jgi:hypothetical protein
MENAAERGVVFVTVTGYWRHHFARWERAGVCGRTLPLSLEAVA